MMPHLFHFVDLLFFHNVLQSQINFFEFYMNHGDIADIINSSLISVNLSDDKLS